MAVRRRTARERKALKDRLERAITTYGWSHEVQTKFSTQEGIDPSTVRRYRQQIHAEWRRMAEEDGYASEEDRREWILRLRDVGRRALEAGQHTAAIRALTEEGRALGYYAPDQVQVEHTHTVDLRRLTDAELVAYEELVVKATADPPLLLEVVK